MQKRKLKNTNKQTNKTNYHAFVRKRREVSVLMKKKKKAILAGIFIIQKKSSGELKTRQHKQNLSRRLGKLSQGITQTLEQQIYIYF